MRASRLDTSEYHVPISLFRDNFHINGLQSIQFDHGGSLRDACTKKEGDDVTSHRSNADKAPNVAGDIVSPPRHSAEYRVTHVLRTGIILVVLAALTFAGTAAAAVWVDISSTINNRSFQLITQANDDDKEPDLIDPKAGETVNILLLGQDTREGEGNSAVGGTDESTENIHNADTTIVAQIAADRSYINLVSIPRDSMVDVPSCSTSNGTLPAQYYVQFNSIFANAYAYGGDLASAAGCTLNAVNSLTGLNIESVVVVDFQGLSSMIDSLGGVDICIPLDVEDTYTGLNLTRGMQHLDGLQATQYARMRHGTGTDGSDVMRTTRQQYLIKALINEALSKNLFTDSAQLYQLARAALQSLNISDSLADAATLAGLAMSLKNLDSSRLYAQTVPVVADPYNPQARVIWSQDADNIWAKLRNGQPLNAQSDTSSQDDQSNAEGTTDAPSEPEAGTDTSGDTSGQTSEALPEPDPNTGLITVTDPVTAQETLIDPTTGGIVNPEDGSITDSSSGQYIGIADRYLMFTVCGVS